MRRTRRLLIAALLAAAAVSCAEPNADLVVRTKEFSLEVTPSSARDGNVIIDIDNTGKLNHELVFARGDDPAKLALTPEGGVDLTKIVVADRVNEFAPGRFRIISPDMRPGDYVLFCPIVGTDGQPGSHFQQGMRTQFRITATVPQATDDL